MDDATIGVGLVVGCHGLRGELKVRPWTDDPARFGDLTEVLVEGEDSPRIVEGWRLHKGHVLLTLSGIPDRTAAEAFRGKALHIPREDRRELPEGRYYHDDLVGLTVQDPGGEVLGEVVGFDDVATPSGLLEIRLRSGAHLDVPFVEAWVDSVDLETGTVTLAARWRQLKAPVDA